MRKLLREENGDLSFFTIFVVLAINMILAFVLLNASIRINCINIRNAAKMELNNTSATIYADTFHSQREANLTSYMEDVNLSPSYKDALESDFIDGMENRIPLATDNYTISNIHLAFSQSSGKIIYIFSCNAEFRITMFGELFPPITKHITLIGSHNTKY